MNKQNTLNASTLKRMAKDARVRARIAEKRAKSAAPDESLANNYRAQAASFWGFSEIHDTEAKRIAKMR